MFESRKIKKISGPTGKDGLSAHVSVDELWGLPTCSKPGALLLHWNPVLLENKWRKRSNIVKKRTGNSQSSIEKHMIFFAITFWANSINDLEPLTSLKGFTLAWPPYLCGSHNSNSVRLRCALQWHKSACHKEEPEKCVCSEFGESVLRCERYGLCAECCKYSLELDEERFYLEQCRADIPHLSR